MVGLTRPKRFALGAAMPATPSVAGRDEQRVRDRMRRAAQADGRLAGGGGRRPCRAGARTITVSGPGQKASIRRSATGGNARGEALGAGAVGDVDDQRMVGRPALGAKILATAASSSARAPRP